MTGPLGLGDRVRVRTVMVRPMRCLCHGYAMGHSMSNQSLLGHL